jgi:hypothetical protein
LAAVWLGGATLLSFFLMPAIRDAGQDGGKVMTSSDGSTWVSRTAANANDWADSNDGTIQGVATFVAGEVGQAFQFNGSGQFVFSFSFSTAGAHTLTAVYVSGPAEAAYVTGSELVIDGGWTAQ